jgi:hydroxypyruvate isomerase
VTIRHLVDCSIIFTELPVLERPAAARAAGFDAVKFWRPFAELAQRCTDRGTGFPSAGRRVGRLDGHNRGRSAEPLTSGAASCGWRRACGP